MSKTLLHAWRSYIEFNSSAGKIYYTLEDGSEVRVTEVKEIPIGEEPVPGSAWPDLKYIGIVKSHLRTVNYKLQRL